MRINDDSNFMIHSWMVEKLHLKGNELLIYALIYNFPQDGRTFTGTTRHISNLVGSTMKTASNVLEALIKRGLIASKPYYEDGVKFSYYYATSLDDLKELNE